MNRFLRFLIKVKTVIREVMGGVMPLEVALVVDMHIGKNWQQC